MSPGQLLNMRQVSDSGVNFASVYNLMPVTVHLNLSLPWTTSRGGLPGVQHRVAHIAKIPFLHVNRTQKLSRGKSSLAHGHYECLE